MSLSFVWFLMILLAMDQYTSLLTFRRPFRLIRLILVLTKCLLLSAYRFDSVFAKYLSKAPEKRRPWETATYLLRVRLTWRHIWFHTSKGWFSITDEVVVIHGKGFWVITYKKTSDFVFDSEPFCFISHSTVLRSTEILQTCHYHNVKRTQDLHHRRHWYAKSDFW